MRESKSNMNIEPGQSANKNTYSHKSFRSSRKMEIRIVNYFAAHSGPYECECHKKFSEFPKKENITTVSSFISIVIFAAMKIK